MALAISDILQDIPVYLTCLPNRGTNTSFCRLEGWLNLSMSLGQGFVMVVLVNHLSRTLRLKESPFSNTVKDLWLLLLALYIFAGILASIPLFTDDYGMRPQGVCGIPENTTFRVYLHFLLLYGIVWICLIYSTIRMTKVLSYYNHKTKQIKKKSLSLAFQNPVLQESSSGVKHNATITVDSHPQSPTLSPISPSLMSRLSPRLFGSSSVQKQDNMTPEDRIMRVIHTLRWYPVVDIICWLPFTVLRTVQLIIYPSVYTPREWQYGVLLGFLDSMGLGHAVIFFCNTKVRKTLREYISKTRFETKTQPHVRKGSIELTSV